jgi:hypothetical protein
MTPDAVWPMFGNTVAEKVLQWQQLWTVVGSLGGTI